MKQFFSFATFFFLSGLCLFAQNGYYHSDFKRTTGNSGTGANIDVKYHRFEWYINPYQDKNITGNVTTYFVTILGKKHLDQDQKINGTVIEIKNNLDRGIYYLKISGKEINESGFKLVVL